jgi:hypothetical protein
VEVLQQLATENDLTLLSMNLYSDQKNVQVFSPYLLTQAGELQIAILGLTGPLSINQKKQGYNTRSWQETLAKTLQEVENKADLIILLSSLPRQSNKEIAMKFNNIHLIVQSGQGGNNQVPVNINNTLLCQTASRGKYLGHLQIDWNDSKTWGKDNPDQLQKEYNRLDRINWQIGRMQKRFLKTELSNNTQFQQLLTEKDSTELSIRNLEKNKEKGVQIPCSYKNNFIALKTSLPEDKTIKAIIDQTRREVNQINRKVQQERRKKREDRQQTGGRLRDSESLQEMAGWQSCKKCHLRQVEFYLQTSHAKALQTLVTNDQQFNPDCLLCHVTLPTYDPRKIQEMDILGRMPLELQNVSCESCHGPARSHTRNPENVPPKTPVLATCIQCHTDERDDNFIFTEKLEKIRCPAG